MRATGTEDTTRRRAELEKVNLPLITVFFTRALLVGSGTVPLDSNAWCMDAGDYHYSARLLANSTALPKYITKNAI